MNDKELKSLSPELLRLIRLSTHDPYLGDIVLQKKVTDIVEIHYDKKLVGFAVPRKDSDGRWRTGPIFIDPVFRSNGYGSMWIKDFFVRRRGRAYINPTNTASIKAFTRAGFKETNKVMMDGDEKLIQYLKD